MTLLFSGIPTDAAVGYWGGGPDANGQQPERHRAGSGGLPCRHCLGEVVSGEEYLVLAHRPFPAPQPYAEIGPIFLHAEPCPAYEPRSGLPERERTGDGRILRGYGADHRIVYGTGQVVANAALVQSASGILTIRRWPTSTYAAPPTTASRCGSSAARLTRRFRS